MSIAVSLADIKKEGFFFSIGSLSLCNFRNHENYELNLLSPLGGIALLGSNGSGKTNVLEALSLLQGRGLRGARGAEMAKNGGEDWLVTMALSEGRGYHHIDLSWHKGVRRLAVDDCEQKLSQWSDNVPMMWLTPDSERESGSSPEARRRLLDHITTHFEKRHRDWLRECEKLMRERSRLLRWGGDERWLGLLEEKMARLNVAIAASRHGVMNRLNRHALTGSLPPILLSMDCLVDGWLTASSALDVEEHLSSCLKDARQEDARLGGASYGIQKSDFVIRHGESLLDGRFCSTGEQKLLTLAVFLKAVSLLGESGRSPILFLDEAAAHLDPQRRSALYEQLDDLKVQYWVTGSDERLFDDFKGEIVTMEAQS